MAETSLRAYVREIDDLIEHEQLDEAIAHARHILQTYPRHLDTYRLLGKAYLEAKRYGDSADILQRVLSAVPDDFVAHVGMSIVREDEGNIDAAIWHMERAFETNPSNAAVQGELRRLIGRRDGLEPPKVRLTRGALARMYAHGELYPQAIAELRAALTEDPDRPDLQVLLAEMYWRTNHRAEAAEVASAILASLPNCREANRIMAAALHAQGRTEEALTYHRRVAALDPYSALVETIQDDAASVDANAVRIEKLVWQPGQPVGRDTGPSDWATGGAGRTAARPAPPRPTWLDSLGAETKARAAAAAAAAAQIPREQAEPEPVAAVPAAAAPEPGGPIPEWMQAAGWVPGTGQAPEGPVSFSDDELRSLEAGMLPPDAVPEPEGGLARADIPDWLKDVAPPDADAEPIEALPPATGGPVAADSSGLEEPRLPPGWSGPAGGGEDQDDDWLRAAAGEAPAVPTWMEEQSPGATATIVTWLGDRSRRGTSELSTPEAAAVPGAPEEAAPSPAQLPEWLADQAPPSLAESAGAGDEAVSAPPAWLSGVAEAAAKGTSLSPEEVSWDQATSEEPIQTGMYPDEAPPAQPAELPEWLQTIASSEAAGRPPGETGPEWLQPAPTRASEPAPPGQSPSESFGWLRELAASEPPTPASTGEEPPAPSWMSEPATGARTSLGQAAGPEWLRGIGEPETAGGADTSSMDWLRGIAEAPPDEPAPAEEPALPARDEPSAGASMEWLNLASAGGTPSDSTSTGEWLRMLKQDGVPAAEPAPEVPPIAAAAAVAASTPRGDLDDAQVFDWLEALAAKQGIPTPETVGETPAAPPQAPPSPPVRAEPTRAIPEEPDAGLQWLEELAAEQTTEVVAAPPPAAHLPPAPPPAPIPVQPIAAAGAAVPPPAAAPPISEAAPPVTEPTPQVPDWLKQLVAETPPPEAAPAEVVSPAAETLPALPEWMVAPQPAEDEPTVPPLPPVMAARVAPEPAPAEPIDELAESWVPPWEQLAEEPAPAAEAPVSPTDETVVRRPEPHVEETWRAIPEEPIAEEAAEPEPATPEPVRYKEPSTDVLQEVPDWLRTPAPRPRAAAPEPEPEPVPEPAHEDDFEVPDWLVAPAPVAAVAAPPPAPPAPVRPAPPPEPAPVEIAPAPPAPVQIPEPIPEPAAAVAPPVRETRREPVPPTLPAATSTRKAPGRAPKPKAAGGLDDKLVEARQALAMGDYRRAAAGYAAVIKRKYQLDEVTTELETAVKGNPKAAPLWQALGDAYMKGDRLPDAISAYERGMAAA
jgi:tetratricopeptide (TPR) repeat protein